MIYKRRSAGPTPFKTMPMSGINCQQFGFEHPVKILQISIKPISYQESRVSLLKNFYVFC